MAFLPGSFMNASVTAVKIQYRLFLIPWVKRNNCVSCGAKARDYSSSLPVKYTPKRSYENEKTEAASLPVSYLRNSSGSVLDAESNNRNACCASDGNDGQNLVKEDIMALDDEFIEEPDEFVKVSSKKFNGINSGLSRQDVEKSAVKLLASRAFTALELKKKLQGKRFPLEIIDAVITDFQSRGLINDCLYAEAYSRSRWSSSSWGPRRIKQELFKKGVNGVDTENAIKQVFQNNGGDEDNQHTGLAMSKLSIDQLYVQASKQWHRSRDVSDDTRKSRMVRWLQYRGFNWSVITLILKKLESQRSS